MMIIIISADAASWHEHLGTSASLDCKVQDNQLSYSPYSTPSEIDLGLCLAVRVVSEHLGTSVCK